MPSLQLRYKYRNKHENNSKVKFFQVEASFAVPLLTIPVGGETTNIHGENTGLTVPKIDVNLKSVVTVASIFLLVFVLLPKILKFHSPSILTSQNFRSDSKILQS